MVVAGLLFAAVGGCAISESDSKATQGLAGTTWLAEDIDGRGVLDRLQSTLVFDGDQRIAGSAGCNRFTGTVQVTGDQIRIGPLAATKRMCPPAIMDQEQRFLAALQAADRYRLTEEGLLVILDGASMPRLRFSRTSDAAPGG